MVGLTRTDRLLLFCLLFLAAAFLLARSLAAGGDGALAAQVELGGRTVARFHLPAAGGEQKVSVAIPGGRVYLSLTSRGARILPMPRALCPRGICAHSGRIGRPGEALVCAPNRLVVRLVAHDSRGLDAIAR